MENLRQRTRREIESAKVFGHQAFAKDIISVADVLEMALEAIKKLPEVRPGLDKDAPHTPTTQGTESPSQQQHLKDLIEGLQMTLTELHRAFSKHGISAINPLHQRFDPNLHSALYEVSSTSIASEGSNGPLCEPGVVVAVQKKGYTINGRLLRSASVGVSK